LESRKRGVQVPAANGGAACEGGLEEVRPCQQVDCKIATWTAWSTCDQACGGGTRTRHRPYLTLPRFGGKPCFKSVNLHEIEACNRPPCHPDKDCAVDIWGAWLPCSVTCGDGQQSRARKVKHPRKMGGIGCNLPLMETRVCSGSGCTTGTDCVWADWAVWSTCSLTCGGGEQIRNREIAVMPKKGGKPCDPIPKEEMIACNAHRCAIGGCTDGKWGMWAMWGACSKSCDGGVAFRSRLVAIEANWCGNPAVGPDRDFRQCSQGVSCGDVDCKFSRWSAWSACTQACSGIKRRSRVIEQQVQANGKACSGALKETAPCNPGFNETTPAGCASGAAQHVTCEFGEWNVGGCSSTCGGGRRQKTRHENIGASLSTTTASSCNGAIDVVEACNTQLCPQDIVTQCKWGDWTQWGACDKCGGQKKRHRQIMQMPANGAVCPVEASEDLAKCPRVCHGIAQGSYCTWQAWDSWGSCDMSCGKGVRKRRRILTMVHGGDLPDSVAMVMNMARLYEDGEHAPSQSRLSSVEQLEDSRMKELAMAFAGGCAFFVVTAFALQRFSRHHQPVSSQAPLE